jgi:UDP-N-acetylglucosamine--N-acetylmuramyl-(pentapeptide) pyrophosphoryl-undecaprenol N-acetylglucosamine transferase
VVTILLAGGGTGGHVFPMIAVGDALVRADASTRVVYVGTARGIEARVVPERGGTLELMNILPLRGGGASGFAKGALRAAASIPEARALVKRLRPSVVLSVGGYAAGPVSLAARTAGIPLAVLEPNSALGLANRLLSPIARRAYTAFPEVERFFRPSVIVRAGVPLRSGFARSPYAPHDGRVRLLVLGGSQGAVALNETVPRAIACAVREGADLEVVHQSGRGRDDVVRALYTELGLGSRARAVPFIDDVPAELASADVVVGRAGASSLAELCAVGRASILVPYPFAADDHQLKNARSLESAGAAVCVPQAEASEARLAAEIRRVAGDGALRARMAEAAASRGMPDAASRIAEDLLALAQRGAHDSEKRSD